MAGTPKISLVMKVYNGEAHLREAVDSILAQTYTDFELLIIDDGSTDSSVDIIKSYDDERIRFLQNEKNMGLCATQNRVIDAAAGEYIAVMDCDDISYPTRFEKQAAYLDAHSEVMMCGSLRDDLTGETFTPFQEVMQLTNQTLQFSLYFGNMYFTHSSIMFRAREYRDNGLSYGSVPVAEDYAVIIEMARRYPIALLPERLIAYRIYPQSTSKTRAAELTAAAVQIKSDYLRSLPISQESKEILLSYFETDIAQASLQKFLNAVGEVARQTGADISREGNAYPTACEIVKQYCVRCRRFDLTLWKTLKKSEFREIASLRSLLGWKLWGACVLRYKRK